jgi:hypothetical protein
MAEIVQLVGDCVQTGSARHFLFNSAALVSSMHLVVLPSWITQVAAKLKAGKKRTAKKNTACNKFFQCIFFSMVSD